MIHHLFRSIGHFIKQHQVAVRAVARTLPMAVREIDKWINTASYQVAVEQVAAVEQHDSDLLFEIYTKRQHEMSSEVRRRFEERLRQLGRIR